MKRSLRRALLGAAALAVPVVCVVLLDRLFPPPIGRLGDLSTVVVDRTGAPLRFFTTREGFWRLPVRLDEVAPTYLELLVAVEDRRFHAHAGVDPIAVARAVAENLAAGRTVSGASTLTMQLARLLEPRPRTLASKLLEALRAVQLEARYDKARILEMYLTLAPFGGNLEGLRAASLAYLGKEPRSLTAAEAALLVALPRSPTRLRPDRHPEAAARARERALGRALAAGAVDARTVAEAGAEPVPAARVRAPGRPSCAPPSMRSCSAPWRASQPGPPRPWCPRAASRSSSRTIGTPRSLLRSAGPTTSTSGAAGPST